jgi:2-iminobutanoate/2-iminopropanoate deaminase
MARKAYTAKTAAAVGPYSHAVEIGGIVSLSGQTPRDPKTGQLVKTTITAETNQCLDNLFAVLEASSLTTDDDFAEMNAAYIQRFKVPLPARTTIGVASLPMGARVEIGMMAVRPKV